MIRPLSFFLLLFVFACGDANDAGPGKAARQDAGPDHADNGDGETPPVSLPDPGNPPLQATGIFSFDYLQEGSGEAKLKTSAIFTQPAQNLASSQFQDLFSRYAQVPLDTCVSLPTIGFSDGSQASPIDAGEVSVVAPDDGRHAMTRNDFFGFVVYDGELPGSAFQPLARYRLEASGAAVPAFSGEFWTPSELTVTAPVANGPLSVARDQPLELAWEGKADGEPVIVRIVQMKTIVTCRLTDDGAFTIPPSALAYFSSSGSVDRGNDDSKDSLTVERFTWYSLGEGQSQTLAIATVGAKYEVNFR